MNENVDLQQVEAPNPVKPVTPQAPRRRFARIVWIVVLVVVAALAWRYWPASAPAPDAQTQNATGGPPQTVRDAAATTGDMPITIDALGAVTPLATITVKTQIAGRLMEVGFQEGQMVKQGDFLAQIDSRPYEATLAQAQAQLAKDTSLYEQAQADLARYETLVKQDSIARQQVEDQQFLVAQDKAAMGSDQAQIDTAKLNISYCHITSPVAGRVGLRQVDPGNYLQPSDTTGIVIVTEIDPISVVFSTAEDNLPQIAARMNAGAKLTATAYDRTNSKALASGTVSTYDNQIDLTTGTFKVRAQFDNPDGALFPNQFVNIKLLVDTISGATLAPNAAIQIGASGSFAYVVNADSTVAVRKVTTGVADAKNTVIVSGLKPGENVVIDGVDRLRDGVKVVVRNGGGASAATPADASGAGQRHKRAQGQGDGAPTAGAPSTLSPSPSPASTPSPSPTATP
jgi:multidrug efflux system membrane fusion protein